MTIRNYNTIQCHECTGSGIISDHGSFGFDFYGPMECDCCEGKGYLFITPNNRLVAKKGGQFKGRL